MAFLFDTSVAIALRDGSPSILERVARLRSASLSIVSVVELHGGVARSTEGRLQRAAALAELLSSLKVLDFGIEESAVYSRVVNELGFSRSKVLDRMIAAQALVASATLATLNPRDFRNIPDLVVEDWSD